jgi:hypothetical protein
MKLKLQQNTLVDRFKGKMFKNINMKTSTPQSTQNTSKNDTKEEQIKKLNEQRKKKAQELQKIEKMNIPKEEKERRRKSVQTEIQRIDASILQLKSPKKNVKKKSMDMKG